MLWSIFIFIVTISTLITVHELGHFFVARLCRVKVAVFSIGFGSSLLRYKGKETEFRLSLIPLGGYVKMMDSRFETVPFKDLKFAFDKQSALKRSAILIAGPFANFLFAFILYWMISLFGVMSSSKIIYPEITTIVQHSAAEEADLHLGDKLRGYKTHQNEVMIDLPPTLTPEEWNEFVEIVHHSPILYLEIERDHALFLQKTNLKLQNLEGKEYYSLGIYPKDNTILIKYSILDGFKYAAQMVFYTTQKTLLSFYQLLAGKIGLEQLSGPVSIAQAATEASEYGFRSFVGFCAFISLSLGIMNLIPLPALDGGQLFLLGIEKIKRSPLSHTFQMRFFQVGFIMLIVIMGIALFNDFNRI